VDEDLVSKLENFGLTVNQSKVYLSIVQHGKTRVSKISKGTQLHRQDIYKLLPKLERMGLITRTIGKPFMLEALSMEKALGTLILKEKEKQDQRISCLQKNLKEVENSLGRQQETREDDFFTLLTTDNAIRNRTQIIAKKIRKEMLIVATAENIKKTGFNYFRDILKTVADNRAKTRLIIANSGDIDTIKQTIDKIAPNKGEFTARISNPSDRQNYQIFDSKELCVATERKTETGHACLFWTNDQTIVDVFKGHFKRMWNISKSVILQENNVSQTKEEPLIADVISL
jgi:sugar-specific transcriptional regulator TrmB